MKKLVILLSFIAIPYNTQTVTWKERFSKATGRGVYMTPMEDKAEKLKQKLSKIQQEYNTKKDQALSKRTLENFATQARSIQNEVEQLMQQVTDAKISGSREKRRQLLLNKLAPISDQAMNLNNQIRVRIRKMGIKEVEPKKTIAQPPTPNPLTPQEKKVLQEYEQAKTIADKNPTLVNLQNLQKKYTAAKKAIAKNYYYRGATEIKSDGKTLRDRVGDERLRKLATSAMITVGEKIQKRINAIQPDRSKSEPKNNKDAKKFSIPITAEDVF